MLWMSVFSTAVPLTLWLTGHDWLLVSTLILMLHTLFIVMIRTVLSDNDVLFFIYTGFPILGISFLFMVFFDSKGRCRGKTSLFTGRRWLYGVGGVFEGVGGSQETTRQEA